MKQVLLAGVALIAMTAAAAAACTTATPNYAASSGGFGTVDGQIYAPDGTPWIAHGVNVTSLDQNVANNLLSQMPGLNFVRVAVYRYSDPSTWADAVKTLTAHGVVVEFEDHTNSTGANAGGGQGSAYSGQALANELGWYSAMAGSYAKNPYVWFGTDNEPPAPGLAQWEQQTYQAIRSAGNNNPILLEMPGGGVPGTYGPGTPMANVAQGMTNVIADVHFYGWAVPGWSADQSTISNQITSMMDAAHAMQSQDGSLPTLIGETGDSTDGATVDPNGAAVVNAVMNSGNSFAAWAFENWAADGLLNGGGLSSFGQQVASYIAAHPGSGCAASPIPDAVVYQKSTDASGNTTFTATTDALPTIQQVAADAITQSNASAAAQASDPTMNAKPIVLAANAPGGAPPPPPPAVTSSIVQATGSDATVVVDGDGTGTVSGYGNVIQADKGAQTLTVSGTGNTLNLGPYDDQITLTGGGNTVNTGGGNDTVVLSYGKSSIPNGDQPALPAISKVGNTIVLPPLGQGVVTIKGRLAANDQIDLTQTLAGLAGWTHDPTTRWKFITALASSDGCTLWVNNQKVAELADGAPNGELGSFVVAN